MAGATAGLIDTADAARRVPAIHRVTRDRRGA